MASNENNSVRLSTTTLFAGLAIAAMVLAPAASATGWLVNYEGIGPSIKFGSNVFGGQGDTVDVGLFNTQCSDEDDFVDVGVMNREGDLSCGKQGECHGEEGESLLGDNGIAFLPSSETHPHDPHCSDDGDTVDVGVLNDEGGYYDECFVWDDPTYPPPSGEDRYYSGDEDDAVDVGAFNDECNDDDDAVDAGVFNCEWSDRNDGVDVGAFNSEYYFDDGDTFDVSLFNFEMGDGPDQNGLNTPPINFGLFRCKFIDVAGPLFG